MAQTMLPKFKVSFAAPETVKVEHDGVSVTYPFAPEPHQARIDELTVLISQRKAKSAHIGELGDLLYQILLGGASERFSEAYSAALGRPHPLRVELDFQNASPAVAALPWEFMRVGGFYLAVVENLALVRRLPPGFPKVNLLPPESSLQVGVILSKPNNLGEVDYTLTGDALNTLKTRYKGHFDYDVDPNANRESVPRTIPQSGVFHFVGHGQLYDSQKRAVGQIALTKMFPQEADWINADELPALFGARIPILAVFQACETASLAPDRPLVGVAASMVSQLGVPSVVAMQYTIENQVAQDFVLEFYDQLVGFKKAIPEAAQSARRKLAERYGYGDRGFATPVIFLGRGEGELYAAEVKKDTSGQGTAVPQPDRPPPPNALKEQVRDTLYELLPASGVVTTSNEAQAHLAGCLGDDLHQFILESSAQTLSQRIVNRYLDDDHYDPLICICEKVLKKRFGGGSRRTLLEKTILNLQLLKMEQG